MLQIVSPGSNQAADLAHSRVGISGSTRTERPVALGSLSLLDDEDLFSPMANSRATCTFVRLCALGEAFRVSGYPRGAPGLQGEKLSEYILGHTFR